MRHQPTRFLLAVISAAVLLLPGFASAQVRDRISQPLELGEGQPLRGNVHPLALPANDAGQAPASMVLHRMLVTFNRTAAQQTDLDALLAEQQNPLSPYYHHWLTPEQFADRFGMSDGDIAKVTDWLKAQGFTVDEVSRSRTYVAFSGTVAQVESAFHTTIHNYVVHGKTHYANASDPVLPLPLANVVTGIQGLHNFLPKPKGIRPQSPRPDFTSSLSGNHFLAPDDFATIYNLKPLYASGLDGSGQKLAVMGQTDLVMSDISTFRSVSGLPVNVPQVVLVPGSADPGVVNGDIDEADLDIQWSGAVARNATIIYVNSNKGAFDSMSYAVSQNLAPVISISYGDCEPKFQQSEITSLQQLGTQANSQGQTILSASGDSGAADCDYPPANSTTPVTSAKKGLAVDIPAALPSVTGVGGTTFNEGSGTYWNATNNSFNGSATGYIPETAWNDTTFEIANQGSLAATGGGDSTLFDAPTWQVAVLPTGANNQCKRTTSCRNVPDVSFAASFDHDGYLLCSQGSCVNGYREPNNNLLVVGGTSAGAPVMAGLVALLNQQSATTTGQGNINTQLYPLAGTSVFHDITSGDNKVPCTTGSTDCPSGGTIGYSAGTGYDQVTGLGSVDANALAGKWAGNGAAAFTLSMSPGSASITSGGTTTPYTVTVTPTNGFNKTVTLGTGGLPGGATASFPTGASVDLSSGTAQTATLQLATTTSTLGGNYFVTVTGASGAVSRGTPFEVSIADFQLAPTPAKLTLTAGTTGNVGSSSVAVSSVNGYTGTVALSCSVSSGLPGTTCSVSSASAVTGTNVTVTVTAPTTHALLHAPGPRPGFFPWTDGTFALALGFVFAGKNSRPLKRNRRVIALAVLLVLVLAMMSACGGGGSKPTTTAPATTTTVAQTGTVTVTGTSNGPNGVITRTAAISVTVK